ncbi:IS3 family transposase, partial [Catellatospora sp. NPDC049609]|uniref:IS3 family transposase n=1 Tax=Catellatospora sp. NPDC049609 TaxID=3155505 RepID=UPI00341EB76F
YSPAKSGHCYARYAATTASREPLLDSYRSVNGMMESFWGRMQTELLDRQRWKTRIELANAIFDYLEIFHNRQRRHSSLNMLSPIEYERVSPLMALAAA